MLQIPLLCAPTVSVSCTGKNSVVKIARFSSEMAL
jgi:hypothetical protein